MNKIRTIIRMLVCLCLVLSCVLLTGCETIATLKEKIEQMNQGSSIPDDGESSNDENLDDGNSNGSASGDNNSSDNCVHRLTRLPWSAPTCMVEGKKGAFKCTLCNQIFVYSAEKDGLVKADGQESIPKTEHSVSGAYTIRLKDGVKEANSFDDFEIVTVCKLCNEGFTVSESQLKSFTPSTKLLYDDVTRVDSKREMIDGRVSTTYTLPSSTKVGVHNWVYHNSDNGELNANTKVPFSANTDRYILMLVKNNSDEQVSFKYGAEYYGAYCWSDRVTVESGSYAAFVLKLNFGGSDYACYHSLQLLEAISGDVSLSFTGYFVN